jgi:hypothetical protein
VHVLLLVIVLPFAVLTVWSLQLKRFACCNYCCHRLLLLLYLLRARNVLQEP